MLALLAIPLLLLVRTKKRFVSNAVFILLLWIGAVIPFSLTCIFVYFFLFPFFYIIIIFHVYFNFVIIPSCGSASGVAQRSRRRVLGKSDSLAESDPGDQETQETQQSPQKEKRQSHISNLLSQSPSRQSAPQLNISIPQLMTAAPNPVPPASPINSVSAKSEPFFL
jgi:hypothetical protein